jgi:hypothetical protein
MLNGISNAIAADPASTFLSDTHRSGTDGSGAHVGSGPANTSAIDRATQVDHASALFKKIFDDEGAWLDPHERTSMLNVMAAVSLEVKGFNGTGVVVHPAGSDGSASTHVERPNARLLHVFHPERSGGKKLDVMVGLAEDVGRPRQRPPMGWGDFSVEGVAKALCTALTRSPTGAGSVYLAQNDFIDFEKSLRGAMRSLVEDDPAKFLRLARQGARTA